MWLNILGEGVTESYRGKIFHKGQLSTTPFAIRFMDGKELMVLIMTKKNVVFKGCSKCDTIFSFFLLGYLSGNF